MEHEFYLTIAPGGEMAGTACELPATQSHQMWWLSPFPQLGFAGSF
jgi:hypothetical protein